MAERKGVDMSIETVAKIVLVILVLVLVFTMFSDWFQQIVSAFIHGISFPSM
ncbi:MAG: hypothetical protein ABEJ69_00870 [Candidatus Nanohaloarchaea archaeon]